MKTALSFQTVKNSRILDSENNVTDQENGKDFTKAKRREYSVNASEV